MLRFVFTGIAAGALIAAGVFASNDLRDAIHARDRLIDEQARALIAAERLRGLDERRARTSRSLLLTGNPRFYSEWQLTVDDFYDLLARLRSEAGASPQSSVLARIDGISRANDARVGLLLTRRLAGEEPAALGKLFETQVQPERDELDRAFEEFLGLEQARLRSSPGTLTPEEQRALGFIFAITIAAVVLAIVAAWTARRATMSANAAAAARLEAESELAQRKKTETVLEAKTLALERSNAELERFAYVASHDLQEPLRTVAGFTELLGRRYKGRIDKDADDFITYAVSGVAQMQRLITDLLTFSRIATQAAPPKPIDSGQALERALRALRASIESSNAHITRSNMPHVLADETQLSQVFQNLLSNAIKFGRNGSTQIRVSAEQHGEEWEFSVADNGIGIEPQYFDRIFVLFQRLHERDRYEGTGLGLAIAKKVIELYGGRMWVESTLGRGSTFHFTLKGATPALLGAASRAS